ncbi:TetR/AcrR family transcriptional regulator [Actinospica sp. MGRD01-02]|uniref:TetR/AcrR family transcriptional regulator n=1 Tax=Actinospica acidithermotolerans TaxID=2828514 RepID=A0A941IGW0_9ACTN|nr:TetR/AcrR family transcriptional regulator [Actinospica acidithermotolerans]MBR7826559.1 TetR/AcrR family transcriptional regulator [Actinospica acidithermotolerans]
MATDEEAPQRPKRLTRAESKARTRELLLDAAAETFARKGYAGASVEEIAESAGFSIGALYSNFGGKQELFLALLESRASDRIAEAAQLIDGRQPDGTAAAGLGKLLIETADEDVAFESLRAEFWLYAVRNPESMATFAERVGESRDALTGVIARLLEGQGRGTDYPLQSISTVVIALFHGLVQLRRIDPGFVSEDLFERTLACLFTEATMTGVQLPGPSAEQSGSGENADD